MADAAPVEQEPNLAEPLPRWLVDHISEERARARAAEVALAAAKASLAPGSQPSEPQPQLPDQANLAKLVARQKFSDDTIAVRDQGAAQFGPRFNDAVALLNSLVRDGAEFDEFIGDIFAAAGKDQAASFIVELGKNPERISSLSRMPPKQRLIEMAKSIPASVANPAAPGGDPARGDIDSSGSGISKAPRPSPKLIPGTVPPPGDWHLDSSTDEEFSRGFNDLMKKKHQR